MTSIAIAVLGYIEPVTHAQETLTLPRLLLHFPNAVTVLELERVDLERGAVRYRVAELLSGRGEEQSVPHVLAVDGLVPPELKNLKVGQKAVFFGEDAEGQSLTYVEGVWYHARLSEAPWRRVTALRPLYRRCFSGTVDELAAALQLLLLGKEAVVPAEKIYVRYTMKEPHARPAVDRPPDPAPPGGAPADVDRLRAEQRRQELRSVQERLRRAVAEKGDESPEVRELRRELGKRLAPERREGERRPRNPIERDLEELRERVERAERATNQRR